MNHLARIATALVIGLSLSPAAAAQAIEYGDNSSDYAHDGECDDARFVGPHTTDDVDWTAVGGDAADCRAAVAAGATMWFDPQNLQPTNCAAQDFGDDASDSAGDGYCDDPRFFGFTSGISFPEDRGHDASDCLRQCRAGTLFDHPLK